MINLYPEIESYKTGRLKVSDIHELYFELCGNPKGKPAVHLHGGPGGSSSSYYRRYFNPEKYHLIRFHQRGAGESTPHAEIKENTTQDLIADIEKLRQHLGINQWLIYGGSWGSTLALAYAQAFPQRVTEMVLWGIFLGSKEEIAWCYQNGVNKIFPDAWEDFIAPIDPIHRGDLVSAYYKKLTSNNKEEQINAAKVWSAWESRLSVPNPDPQIVSETVDDEFIAALARLECHYFVNNCFLKENELLSSIKKIKHIKTTIVQGRYDMVCPVKYAWKLHRAWPETKLIIVPGAGHSGKELLMQNNIIETLDKIVSQI